MDLQYYAASQGGALVPGPLRSASRLPETLNLDGWSGPTLCFCLTFALAAVGDGPDIHINALGQIQPHLFLSS